MLLDSLFCAWFQATKVGNVNVNLLQTVRLLPQKSQMVTVI